MPSTKKNRQTTKVRVQPNLTRRRFDLLLWAQEYIKQKLSTQRSNGPGSKNIFALANLDSDLLICDKGRFKPFNTKKSAMVILNSVFAPSSVTNNDQQ